jgi:hypothetical protein
VGEIGITDALNDIPRSPHPHPLSEDLSASTESCNTLHPESIPEMNARSNNPQTISGLQLLRNISPIHVIDHSPESLSLQKHSPIDMISRLVETFSPQINTFGIQSLHQKPNTVDGPDRRCNFFDSTQNSSSGIRSLSILDPASLRTLPLGTDSFLCSTSLHLELFLKDEPHPSFKIALSGIHPYECSPASATGNRIHGQTLSNAPPAHSSPT